MGVVVANERDIDQIFRFYDQSGNGRVDYKELSKIIEARQTGEEIEVREPV